MSIEPIRATLFSAQQGHELITRAWGTAKPALVAGHRLHLEIRPDTRSLAQNRRLWSLLTDLSRQVVWHGQRLSPDEWKDVMSAALKRQKVVPGIDGGFVVLGQRTSRMTRAEMVELQDLIEAFGAQQSVQFRAVEDFEA